MIKRGVRSWLAAAAAIIGFALSCSSYAQYDHRQRGAYVQQGGQRGEQADRRAERGRDGAQRRQYERGGSMTPDERRELNRDLQRANREFYRKGRDRQ
jgi:hypothetical protein